MSDFTWDPGTYLDVMAEEIPEYRRLQSELVAAVAAVDPKTILDLGVGNGLTAKRVAETLPQTHIHGIDESEEMLAGSFSPISSSRAIRTTWSHRSMGSSTLPVLWLTSSSG